MENLSELGHEGSVQLLFHNLHQLAEDDGHSQIDDGDDEI
jgi:hypothetical protein